jgi:hypothetical protein
MDKDTTTVTDQNGVEKQMIGRPAGLKDFDIPTGDSHLDWRCPSCGEVGYFRRTGEFGPECTNSDCRVKRYSPFVEEIDDG